MASDPPDKGVPNNRWANEASMKKALATFGWTCGPEFWQRYYTDPWVFSLANAVESLDHEVERLSLAYIEATNPGIDMDAVRRSRAGTSSDA